MKVIRKGNYNNVFPMKIICQQVVDKYGFTYGGDHDFCGSELEIEDTDIKMHKWYKYPDYNGVDFGVICPVCGKFIPIDTCKIPARILDGAEEISVTRKLATG